MIRGLHICKPQNTPRVGDTKPFLLIPMTSAKGKQYTKIKNPQDGQAPLFNILSVEKTNYSDDRGNISFNLEIEPVQGDQGQMHTAVQQSRAMSPAQKPQYTHQAPRPGAFVTVPPQDTPRQHLMRAANLYRLCMDAVDKVIYPNPTPNVDMETWRAAVSSLFIDAQRAGMVAQMPAKPMSVSNESSYVNQEEELPNGSPEEDELPLPEEPF